ncbi:MAG: zinc ribbon domain-containing protein [Ruminococcaceae bacterium]|nr:zinc ribbon domain-containing protein [Oscillospiraceae bacterium]
MFCKNCGTNIGDARFCPNCGTNINGEPFISPEPEHAPVAVENSASRKRSLSFILYTVLGGFTIGSFFISKFSTCLNEEFWSSRYYGYGQEKLSSSTTNCSFWDFTFLSSSSIWAIIAILLFATTIILSFANFFARKKSISVINTVFSSVSFVYMLVMPLVSTHYHCNEFTSYGITKTYVHSLVSFDVLFYVTLAISAFLVVVSIFDTANKPLIKLSK